MNITKSNLEIYLEDNTDPSDMLLQAKKNRYLRLTTMFNQLGAKVKGSNVVIDVGSEKQKYTKVHPAIAEMERINAQLTNLEHELHILPRGDKNTPSNKSPNSPVEDESDDEKGGLV